MRTNKFETKNLFTNLPDATRQECIETLAAENSLRIERIVSHGQATAEGEWYDQKESEWVLLLQGSAGILFEGEQSERLLQAGDYLLIPPHCRHRVAWTAAESETIWLAVFF